MTKQRTQTAMQALLELGQSVWLDYLRRGMLRSGELQSLIDDGLRGMTSNPTIFEQAIGGSSDYDDELRAVAGSRMSDLEIFELLAVEDVRQSADLFRPVYDATEGQDGFVSLEVSPTLARDTEQTIAEARRLWAAGGSAQPDDQGARNEGGLAGDRTPSHRRNQHQHHPALLAGALPPAWRRPMCGPSRPAARAGKPIDRLASVASFFVSRVDTETDRRIEAKRRTAARPPRQGRDRQRAAGLCLVSRPS